MDNLYGKGKKKARELLINWAERNHSTFTGLIIPNVFGPFGRPYYNSVVATFCHQLTHNEQPQINVDATLKLIYVQELVNEIIKIIENKIGKQLYEVPYTSETKVSEILSKLEDFRSNYMETVSYTHLTLPTILRV